MSRCLNRVTLIGNVGKEPEMRTTPGGQVVVSFGFATSEEWKDKGGAMKTETQWHRIVLWGKQAEHLFPLLGTAKKLYIEGRIKYRDWTNAKGEENHTTEIHADRIILLGMGSVDKDADRLVDRMELENA